MPDAFDTLRDRVMKAGAPSDEQTGPVCPSTVWTAIGRGVIGRCPSCGQGKLFRRFLKPVSRCPLCHEDWSPQQADDFPAYVAIFLTGHLLAPIIIALVKDSGLSVGALLAIIVPLAIVLMIGLLQPAKGAIIAVQWWFGMHGFPPRTRS